jgi:hypothetical protein
LGSEEEEDGRWEGEEEIDLGGIDEEEEQERRSVWEEKN